MTLRTLYALPLLLTLVSCSVLVDAPVEPPAPKVINPAIVNAIDLYCRNLINVRRITLRFIRAVDPEWQSVCDRD